MIEISNLAELRTINCSLRLSLENMQYLSGNQLITLLFIVKFVKPLFCLFSDLFYNGFPIPMVGVLTSTGVFPTMTSPLLTSLTKNHSINLKHIPEPQRLQTHDYIW